MEKEKNLILFVHGFIGTPYIFKDYSDRLAADGYSVESIILPGHEGSGLDFAKSTYKDWENHLQAELEKKIGNYEKIILVGHSMGGLLSLCSSVNNPGKIEGLVIIASPIHTKVTFGALRNMVNVAFFKDKHNEQIDTLRENFAIKDDETYLFPLWLKPLMHLNKVIERTKKIVPIVHIPILLIYSEGDEIVNFNSHAYLKENLVKARTESLIVTASEHAYHAKDEIPLIEEAIVKFIDTLLDESDSQSDNNTPQVE